MSTSSPSAKYVVYATACVYRDLHGKITDRKKNCVNNHLIWSKVFLPQMGRKLVSWKLYIRWDSYLDIFFTIGDFPIQFSIYTSCRIHYVFWAWGAQEYNNLHNGPLECRRVNIKEVMLSRLTSSSERVTWNLPTESNIRHCAKRQFNLEKNKK